ncbi:MULTISPECIES: hypothetical protein, partial [unclassified Arthrobacter]|uniref:hypothetical protein n=1 Tax=unclassified Arthrobacter TaxID=235627 RepID=UPI002DFF05D8
MAFIRQRYVSTKRLIAVLMALTLALVATAGVALAVPSPLTTATSLELAVPAGLKSTVQTDTSVTLSWTKSANVPRYRV